MSSSPEVSVIVPTYNRATLVGRAIRSILSQDFQNVEIIVVDDCSSDNTEAVVSGFNSEKIRFFRLSCNSGAASARNYGVAKSIGKYVAFLDSDDEWLQYALSILLAGMLENDNIDIVLAGFIRFYSNNPEYICGANCLKGTGDQVSVLLSENYVSPQIMMIKRSTFITLKGFDVSLSHREDWEFGIRAVTRYHFCFVDRPIAVVYETPGNLTSNDWAKVAALDAILNKHSDIFSRCPRIYARHLRHVGHMHIILGDIYKGKKMLKKSLAVSAALNALGSYILSWFGLGVYRSVSRIFGKSD